MADAYGQWGLGLALLSGNAAQETAPPLAAMRGAGGSGSEEWENALGPMVESELPFAPSDLEADLRGQPPQPPPSDFQRAKAQPQSRGGVKWGALGALGMCGQQGSVGGGRAVRERAGVLTQVTVIHEQSPKNQRAPGPRLESPGVLALA